MSNKIKVLPVRFSESDYQTLSAAASAVDLSVSTWVRQAALAAARQAKNAIDRDGSEAIEQKRDKSD